MKPTSRRLEMEAKTIESGVQLFSRIRQKENLDGINPKLFQHGGPRPNQVIEVVGEVCNDILLDLLVRCILPTGLDENWKSCGAIFVITDHHVNILKITKVLHAHVKKLNVKSRKTIVEQALHNLTILKCYDSEQLEITFHKLEKVVRDKENVSLILVDNITSQYWAAKQSNTKLTLDFYSKTIFSSLHNIIRNLNLVLVFSRYQVTDFHKSLSPNIDYKLIINKANCDQYKVSVINYEKEIETGVPFQLQTFITFL